MLIPDAMWSWWIHPLAVADGDVTWLGSVDRRGGNRVYRIDPTAPVHESVLLAGPVEADDHNAVAIALNPDRDRLIAAYSRHDEDPHLRIQHVDRTTLTLSPQQQLHMSGGDVTYAQLLHSGDTVHVLCRRGSQQWVYRTSFDWGATWEPVKVLVDGTGYGKTYITTRPDPADPDVVHLAVTGHPNSSSLTNVSYGRINLDTGAVTTISGGMLGNLADPGGPGILPTELSQAIVPSGTSRVRTLDLGLVDGEPAIAYAVWSATTDTRYKVKRWTGSEWDSGSWQLYSGKVFGGADATHYHGGAALGDNGQMVTSHHDGIHWMLQRWVWTASTWALLGEMARARTRLIRPYMVRGGTGFIYQDCLYDHFTQFYGDTVADL